MSRQRPTIEYGGRARTIVYGYAGGVLALFVAAFLLGFFNRT